MFKLRKKQKREILRITEYLISGGAYFWSGYALFALLWSGLGVSLWWAKLAANLFGLSINYLLQRFWVFKNPALAKHKTEVTGRYIFITLADFLIDYLIVNALKSFGVTPYIGQFVSSAFFTPWNYLWYRFWVFPEKFVKRKKARATPARVFAHRAHGHSAYRAIR